MLVSILMLEWWLTLEGCVLFLSFLWVVLEEVACGVLEELACGTLEKVVSGSLEELV